MHGIFKILIIIFASSIYCFANAADPVSLQIVKTVGEERREEEGIRSNVKYVHRDL